MIFSGIFFFDKVDEKWKSLVLQLFGRKSINDMPSYLWAQFQRSNTFISLWKEVPTQNEKNSLSEAIANACWNFKWEKKNPWKQAIFSQNSQLLWILDESLGEVCDHDQGGGAMWPSPPP